MTLSTQRIAMGGVLAGAFLGTLGLARPANPSTEVSPMIDSATRLPVEGELRSFAGATGWINSPPLAPAALRGNVVLVDFWTYTCVNWLRTLPYVRAWAAKYRDLGLVVVGVHTPEFSVEHDAANVRRAVSSMRIDYPVALDSDYAVWRAFENSYWPAVYLADAKGRIRYHHFGEGDYEETERAIQQLLAEAGRADVPRDLARVQPSGSEVAADWANVRSEETYVGSEKAANFASTRGSPGRPDVFALPPRLSLNHWALAGEWMVGPEIAAAQKPRARIAYRFHARDLNLVLGPGPDGRPVRFRVQIDGHAPGAAHGTDVDADGIGTIAEPRLYQLIRQPKPIADRDFEIEFLDAGAQAFVFTFG